MIESDGVVRGCGRKARAGDSDSASVDRQTGGNERDRRRRDVRVERVRGIGATAIRDQDAGRAYCASRRRGGDGGVVGHAVAGRWRAAKADRCGRREMRTGDRHHGAASGAAAGGGEAGDRRSRNRRLVDCDGLAEQADVRGARGSGVGGEVEVHHSTADAAKSQPARIARRRKRGEQVLCGRKDHGQGIGTGGESLIEGRGVHERAGQFLDRAVVAVGDVHIAAAVHRHTKGMIQTGGNQRAHRLGRRRPLLDRAVVAVGDVHIATAVHRHASWRVQTGGNQRAHRLGRRRPQLDRAVAGVGKVNIAAAVQRHASWRVQTGCNQCAHRAGRRRPLLDRVVALVVEVHIAAGVHRHAKGISVQTGCNQRAHRAGRCRPLLDRVVVEVGDVHIAAAVHRHTSWRVQTG